MSTHPFSKQRVLFKAYDIRGHSKLFTTDFINALSETFAKHLVDTVAAKTVVIGYDMRQHSEAIAEQLAMSCRGHGITVIWLGLVTTPIMAYWSNQYDGHGIIATASHSESYICGIKWLIAGESPSSESILAVYDKLMSYQKPSYSAGNQSAAALPYEQDKYAQTSRAAQQVLSYQHIKRAYCHSALHALNTLRHYQMLPPISALFSRNGSAYNNNEPLNTPSVQKTQPIKPLKIVIDCLNGATGLYAQAFFAQQTTLLADVILLNKAPDGDFPKGNPDPMEAGRLTELSAAVVKNKADLGLAFDGDGDRLMVIDNQGQPLAPDHLLYLLARVSIEDYRCRTQQPSAHSDSSHSQTPSPNTAPPTVIFDVKCTHHLPRLISEMGAIPQMSKTGSSILRRALQTKSDDQQQIVLFAGELSGHFLFNDGHFLLHDDAMYAGLRLINWLQYQQYLGKTSHLAEIIASLPNMVSTPDIYLPLAEFDNPNDADKPPILNKLRSLCDTLQSHRNELPSDSRLTCIDGLRLDFAHGFGIIRPSNTSNSLTVRFVGDSLSDLKGVQGYFVKLCRFINHDLANKVANISVQTPHS